MRTPTEVPPPRQEVRRRRSCGLCGGLEGGEENEAAWAGIRVAISHQWCEEQGFQQQRFTDAHYMPGVVLLLDWQGLGWARKLFLEPVGTQPIG